MKKKIIFILLFAVIGFILLQVPFTKLLGADTRFTAYDFFSPVAGGFLSTWFGFIAVVVAQLGNFFYKLSIGTPFDLALVARIFPTLFGVLFFATKSRKILLVSLIAIVGWWLNPIGRQVWYFPLIFWLIPVITFFLKERYLFARALGATFTIHSVGGLIWIWTFNLPASAWQALIPQIIVERLLFAGGITLSYILIEILVETIETAAIHLKKNRVKTALNV